MPSSSEPPAESPQFPSTLQKAGTMRVLSPNVAKARRPKTPSSKTPAFPSASGPQSQQPALSTKPPFQTASFADSPSPSSSSSFLSRFRTRFATLPLSARRTFRILRIVAPVIPIGIFFSEHVLQVMWVRGPSMTPYLNEDYDTMHTRSDMVLVNKWPWGGWPWERSRRLERGMIVTFRSPANPSHTAIKRVIGLPGDRITTREPCPKPAQIVPFNHVWLEGDAEDPRKSMDSNTYGPVSISLITGRVIAVLWPRMRVLRWSDWDNEQPDHTNLGKDYRREVRQRVLKGAVKLERPLLE